MLRRSLDLAPFALALTLALGGCRPDKAEAMRQPAAPGAATTSDPTNASEPAPDPAASAADEAVAPADDLSTIEDTLPPETVVARVNGKAIRLSSVDAEIEAELRQARTEYVQNVHMLRRQAIEAQVAMHLLSEEAHRKGMLTLEDYLREEIEDTVPAPSKADVERFFEEHLEGVPRAELVELEGDVREHLHMEAKQTRLLEIVERLRKGADIQIDLPRPRARVRTIGPAMGPESAPVTIVMFSDFQCPYCAEAAELVDDLVDEYEGRVRLVVRDFPLASHPNAQAAAEAARCADEQGLYWPLHARLFAHQDALEPSDLRRHARSVEGLDAERFDECLSSGRMAILVEGDRADGEAAGVQGTPAFFVNGYPVAGLVERRELELIIDSELRALKRSGALSPDGNP